MSSYAEITREDGESTGIPSPRLAMWVFLSSEIVLFGGLIGSCILFRLTYEKWAEYAAHVNSMIGSINTLALLTSSLTVVLAHKMVQNRNYKAVNIFLAITILLGLLFLVLKGIEYSGEIHHGYTILKGPFWAFYFGITGLHALHVLVGIILNAIVLMLSLRNKRPQSFVENSGLYWHFVDVVWIFVFPLFYLS
ncbi:MAG: cytochrome c oxidase subunit 3 [Planctomycetes bacterium]|nr:cytochrome c oxidase subunit 3 [Planctomycetota bacterium]